MGSMETLCDLLFELAHEDRLVILKELSKRKMKLTQLSKNLGLTVQETHRQLSRLTDIKLIMKDPEGFQCPTAYGALVLDLIPGYQFVSKNRDYFLSHVPSDLPSMFVSALGNLVDCKFTNSVVATLNNIEVMITDAEEYIWLMTDRRFIGNYQHLKEAIERGVSIKTIEQKDWIPPSEFRERIDMSVSQFLNEAKSSGAMQSRVLDKVNMFLYMSEREIGGLSFPTLDDRLDYLGFIASDEKSHRWCEDIFQYYWGIAKPKFNFTKKNS